MNMYSSSYNKQLNLFEEGIKRIRNKNSYVFENVRNAASIYDGKDIKSYYTIEEGAAGNSINFRPNSGLPEHIRQDIADLFYSIWPQEAQSNS